MPENPGAALDKLYSMLNDAESLGLSRPARMRLIGIIGSLESEELDRFKSRFSSGGDDAGSRGSDRGRSRDDDARAWGERPVGQFR